MLIGGDPGIGKSTLMLQAAAAIARPGREVVYVSGEESVDQIRLRALRLGLDRRRRSSSPAPPRSATSWPRVDRPDAPGLLIVDSIQTMWVDGLEQAPGTVTQLRAAAQALIRFAKQRGSALMLIGHVTKDGQIAGPRVLEHMVDAVLYFEGERGHQFRILRAVKNRFGPANEIGVFEMAEAGLVPVANPSALFLADREDGVAGSAVFAGMEGTRPLLVEIQALVAPSGLAHAAPRRGRLGRQPAGHAAGRPRGALRPCDEHPRCLSQRRRRVAGAGAGGRPGGGGGDHLLRARPCRRRRRRVFFGEVGLAGEVRAVGHGEARLKEAAKLGFQPRDHAAHAARTGPSGLRLEELSRLTDLSWRRCGGRAAWSRAGSLSGGRHAADPVRRPDPGRDRPLGAGGLDARRRARDPGAGSWVGAAIVAFLALPYVAPLVRPVVAGEAPGRRRGGGRRVFLVALIALKLLSGMVASADRRQRPRPAGQGAGPGCSAPRAACSWSAPPISSAAI